jgi:hypothetical protein
MDTKYKIIKHYTELSSNREYNKEIKLVNWGNEYEPQIEIREWSDIPGYGV